MNLFSVIAAVSLLLVASQLQGGPSAAYERTSVQIGGHTVSGETAPPEASAGCGHVLQEAAVTPSAKFVTVRWRDRQSLRNGLAAESASGVTQSAERPQAVPGLRSFLLRI